MKQYILLGVTGALIFLPALLVDAFVCPVHVPLSEKPVVWIAITVIEGIVFSSLLIARKPK
jgi:hypothetical protein